VAKKVVMAQQNPFFRSIRSHLWFVHAPVTLLAMGIPDETTQKLVTSAKPSHQRLHLQELFIDGRRYMIEPRSHGFIMLTNSKHYWRYTEGLLAIRRRTRSAAKVLANLSPLTEDYTRIELRAHIRLDYFLDIFWVPGFISTIVVGMPWAWWFITVLIVAMFLLSFVYHYYNAAFQANEMIFFIEKVLKEELITSLPTLQTDSSGVLRINEDFEEEWQRFYSKHNPHD
jgi:hypothetical protein